MLVSILSLLALTTSSVLFGYQLGRNRGARDLAIAWRLAFHYCGRTPPEPAELAAFVDKITEERAP